MLSQTDQKLLAALLSRQEEVGAAAELPPERITEIANGSPPTPRQAAALLASPLAREELALDRLRLYNELEQPTGMLSWLDRKSWSRFHTRLLLALAVSWAGVGFQVALMVIFKEAAAKHLGVDATTLGYVIAFSLFGTALGAFVLGRLADRRGRRFVSFTCLGLYAAGAALTPFSVVDATSAIILFGIARFVAGFGIGGEYAAMSAMLQEQFPARSRGRASLAVHACFWLGAGLAALGAAHLPGGSVSLFDHIAFCFQIASWQVAFLASVAFCLPVLLLRRWVRESPRWLVREGRTVEARRIVARIASLSDKEIDNLPPVKSDGSDAEGSRTPLREVWRIMRGQHWATLKLCLALMSVQALFYNAFYFGYAEILPKPSVADTTDFGLLLFVLAASNFVGPLFFGFFLVDSRDGRKWTMAMTFLASGALLLATALAGHAGFDQGQWQVTLVWASIFALASAAASTAYLTTGEQFPLGIRNMAFAFVFALSMVVGGVVGEGLFTLANSMLGQLGRVASCLVVALAMLAAGISAAPPGAVLYLARAPAWVRWFIGGFLKIFRPLRTSQKSFADLAGQPAA